MLIIIFNNFIKGIRAGIKGILPIPALEDDH